MSHARDYEQFLEHVSQNIKEARIRLGLTQEEMAEKFNFNYRFYQKLESGRYSPGLHTIFRLAKALKTTPDKLLKG